MNYNNNQNYNGGNNMNNNTQTQEQTKENIIEFEVDKLPFDEAFRTKFTTTEDLSKMVNRIFADLEDYKGCTILPDTTGRSALKVCIYIQPQSFYQENGIYALEPTYQKQNTGTLISRVKNLNNKYKSQSFMLTDVMKAVLKPFMATERNGKINWGSVLFEKTGRNGEIMCEIYGIDLLKVINLVYGDLIIEEMLDADGGVIETKKKVEYLLEVKAPVDAPQQNRIPVFLVAIMQVDSAHVASICRTVKRYAPQSFDIPMVTDLM